MRYAVAVGLIAGLACGALATAAEVEIREFDLPSGAFPHDVAPGPDGIVWYAGQKKGVLGRLDPATGKVEHIPLGDGSAPHGVIVAPDGAPWLTDGGKNAIVRVDPLTREIKRFPVPEGRGYVDLNTATFDQRGMVWFTGQNGVYGRVDPKTGDVRVFDAPRGRGPYGMATTPDGSVYYASLAGSHIARIDLDTSQAAVIQPPTPNQGARRVWSDSKGRIWVSEWNSGNVSRFNPQSKAWRTWKLPGERPRTDAVYVDEKDIVWLSDWGANAMVRFDPAAEKFDVFPSTRSNANVRQILGRPGEVWAPESGTDRLVVYRTK